jgi:hypothetical protein
MTAFIGNKTLPAQGWGQITDSNATWVAVQANAFSMLVMGTIGAVAPVSTAGAFRVLPGEPVRIDLQQIWPGATRLYGLAESGSGMTVPVSHD